MTLNYRQYQLAAHETAVYPADQAMIYLSTKLAGECGELLNHVGKTIRGDFTLQERHSEIEEELGGILWYATEIFTVLGVKPEEGQKFMPARDVSLFAFVPVARDVFMLSANIIAGADHQDAEFIVQNITNMLGALDILASLIGSDMEKVAQRNLDLLAARAANGSIKGHHRESVIDTNDEAELNAGDLDAALFMLAVELDEDEFDDFEDDNDYDEYEDEDDFEDDNDYDEYEDEDDFEDEPTGF